MTSASFRGALAPLVLISLLATMMWSAAPAWAADCSPADLRLGTCTSATLGPNELVIEGSQGSGGAGGGASGVDASWPDSSAPRDPLADCIYVLNSRCLIAGPGRAAPPQPITWADLAAFRPDPGVDAMEPNGWAIVGLHTNFFAAATVQVQSGSLLGQPAEVRFTPVGFRWDYGDGSAATSAVPGAAWSALGIREFDPTATSHAFANPGEYTVTLSIDFGAEYRVGAMPWTPVAGTLAVPANPLTVSVGHAKTVLVERECTNIPRGPGC